MPLRPLNSRAGVQACEGSGPGVFKRIHSIYLVLVQRAKPSSHGEGIPAHVDVDVDGEDVGKITGC